MLARDEGLATPGESVQGLGDLHLEEVDRHLVCAPKQGLPVAESLDRWSHDRSLGQAYPGDADTQKRPLGLRKSHEHATDGKAFVARAPGGHTEDITEVGFFCRVDSSITVANLA